MNIHINGKAYPLNNETNMSVTAALTLHFIDPHLIGSQPIEQRSTFAVALNGDFVGKTEYDTIIVKNGDSLDVLLPIQGG
jgi:sulfur carrier protein